MLRIFTLNKAWEGEVRSLPLSPQRTAALPLFRSPQVRKLFSGIPGWESIGENDYVGTTENPVTPAFGQG